MDEFARRPAEDRRAYIEEAAARRDLTAIIVEKDFWVCWTLRRLMHAADLAGHMIFKGGTSLSKAYGIIQRFSEDIDLTVSRAAPLVSEVKSPMERDISGKQRERRAKALAAAPQAYATTGAMPARLPRHTGLVSGFCSSAPSFASGFLPTPPRGDAVAFS